jgi:hypothetical protein
MPPRASAACRVGRLVFVLALAAAGARAQDTVFADDFESGNLFRWAARLGEPIAPAQVFRLDDLDLREPHVYVDLGFPLGCYDFTDQDLPLVPGSAFNAGLEAAFAADDDGDGLLDASFLLAFRPFDEAAVALRLDVQGGLCTAPAASTTCAPDPASPPQTSAYDGVAAGVCLAPVAGTTYGPYAPEVPAPVAPGFVSQARTIALALSGVPVPLRQAQLAAAFTGAPVDRFESGLMMGFLAASDADLILLPPDLPLVGGQPLSILLPGGDGNCAGHDDRDELGGVSGWWFYFELTADPAAWSGE